MGQKFLTTFSSKTLTRARDDDDDVLDEWRRRWHDHHQHQQQQRATSKTGRVAGTLADAEEIRRTIRIRCLVENAIGRGTATRLPKVIFYRDVGVVVVVLFFFSRAFYSAKKKKKKRVGGRSFLVSSFASTRDGPRAALTLFFFECFLLIIIFVSSDAQIDTSVDAEHRFVLSLRGCADERGDERRRDEKNVVPLHRRVFG